MLPGMRHRCLRDCPVMVRYICIWGGDGMFGTAGFLALAKKALTVIVNAGRAGSKLSSFAMLYVLCTRHVSQCHAAATLLCSLAVISLLLRSW